MSDTATTDSAPTLSNDSMPAPDGPTIPEGSPSLGGDMPQPGSTPLVPPAPLGVEAPPAEMPSLPTCGPAAPPALPTATAAPEMPAADLPSLPTSAPAPELPVADLPSLPTSAPAAPAAPEVPAAAMPATPEMPEMPELSADGPTLPTAAPAAPAMIEDYPVSEAEALDDDGEPAHPMAHMMPAKSKPTEASIRAAEARAVRKAKGKKIKIGVAIGALIVSALAGPPLVSWLTNAINEAGSSPSEEPAD